MSMWKTAAFAVLTIFGASPAYAQAFGSVHCKASLRQIEVDLKAAQKRLEAVQNSSAADQCSAMRVHAIILEQGGIVFGRCTEGRERDENVAQANTSAAEFRAKIAQNCGG
jgi:hypothetical protein